MIMNRTGSSLITVLASMGLLATGFTAFIKSVSASQMHVLHYQQKAIAQNQAAELLEFFRSLTPSELRQHLINGAFPLCSLIQSDPLASLPPLPLTNAQRYYSVHIVNMRTESEDKELHFNTDACTSALGPALNEDERFFVSVRVIWIPPGQDSSRRETVELSAAIGGS